MTDDHDLGTAMAVAARALHAPLSLDETLSVIVETARCSLPGFDAVGISTIDNQGNIETRAATSELVRELDRIQYTSGVGPCVEAMRDTKDVVVAPRIRDDTRWPEYVQQAVEHGLRSQLAVQLYLDDEGTMGGLNIYSTTSEEIDPSAEAMAELFAAHAAIALGNAREVENLNVALHTRKVIGQAIGLVMHEYTLTDDAAFGFLVRMSSQTNVKIRDLAVKMVESANTKAQARDV